MCGLQCPKKLWQAVYDPGPAEEALPGTAKGMGIEIGIKARLLWPGGVLVDDPEHRDYDAAVRRTKTLIADPAVPAILEATLVYDGVLVRVDALARIIHEAQGLVTGWRLSTWFFVASGTRMIGV
jgi:hypothetical protein